MSKASQAASQALSKKLGKGGVIEHKAPPVKKGK